MYSDSNNDSLLDDLFALLLKIWNVKRPKCIIPRASKELLVELSSTIHLGAILSLRMNYPEQSHLDGSFSFQDLKTHYQLCKAEFLENDEAKYELRNWKDKKNNREYPLL